MSLFTPLLIWLIYTRRVNQNKQIRKDKMKDFQLEDKEISFSFKNDVKCCANKIHKITYPWNLNWTVTNHIALHAK